MKTRLCKLANVFYDRCYPAYSAAYAVWKSYSDRRERALLRKLIRPGMHIVDVGANIGIYSAYFSRLTGPTGRVHAFEPAHTNCRRLRQRTGRLANVSVQQAAVGEHSGEIKLYMSDDLNVDHRTFDSGDGRRSVAVPLVSLDDCFAGRQRIDLIKIDVQGYELNVLRGARRVLTENPDVVVLMEYWPYGLIKAAVEPTNLVDWLQSLAFSVRRTTSPDDSTFESACFEGAGVDDYCNLIVSRRRSAA